MKVKMLKKRTMACMISMAALTLLAGCNGKMQSSSGNGSKGDSQSNNLGQVQARSLSLSPSKLEGLSSCTFDNQCPSDEVCSVLDLQSGPLQKCTQPAEVCSEATCGKGACTAVVASVSLSGGDSTTTITCVSGGDNVGGTPGYAPGNPGPSGGDDGSLAVSSLVVSGVVNVNKKSSNTVTFQARDSKNALIQVAFPNDSECYQEAQRASGQGLSLTMFGVWKAVSGAPPVYQFSQISFCYSGDPIGL